MRTLLVVTLALSLIRAANAQSPPCPCDCPQAAQRELPLALPPLVIEEPDPPEIVGTRRTLWGLIGGSLAVFAVGQIIAGSYLSSSDHADRVLALTPIAGPVVATARDQPGAGWSSALVFSTWLQAASVITAAIAGHALADLRVQPNVALRPGGAAFELVTHF